jgi:Leucine-rich repeat (LRR) protein
MVMHGTHLKSSLIFIKFVFTIAVIQIIYELNSIIWLIIQKLYVGYAGFERLSSLEKLEVLDLSDNRFNSSILSSVSGFTSLKALDLRGNEMEGSLSIQGMFLDILSIRKFN